MIWRIFCKIHMTVYSVEKLKIVSSLKKKFRLINFLVIFLSKPLLSRKFCENSVRENFCKFHNVLWKLRKITLILIGKNFVKATVSLNKLLYSWFDEIFCFTFSILCNAFGKYGNSLLIMIVLQKIREITQCKLISQNDIQCIRIFHIRQSNVELL